MNISQQLSFARTLRKNQTNAEALLWGKLRNRKLHGVKFSRQKPLGIYIVDFVSIEKKLIIELDGEQHNSDLGKRKDVIRTVWLKNQGYNVLRFWNNEVLKELDVVLEMIYNVLTLTPSPKITPSPKSSPQGEGL